MQIPGITLQPAPGLQPARQIQPGQLVPVEVLSLEGGSAAVRVAGQVMWARGEVATLPARFWAQVTAVTPEMLHLQRLTETPTRETALLNLTRLLNLPAGPATDQLLQEMFRWRLPLDRSLALTLLNSAAELPPEERPAFLAARTWLETLDLKTDPAGVRTALAYLLGETGASPRGQEILNGAVPLFPGQEMISFFTFRGRDVSGELYLVEKESGDGREQKNGRKFPLALVVRVDTPVLGETWVYLARKEAGLTARVNVSAESFVPLFQKAAAGLKDRLAALGYRVEDIQVAARQVKCVCQLLPPESPPPYRPLDAVV
ncbi:MAG: flagellar hook-length control protein FliK [Thermoanaerobacteraceae bacterium]|nr:flagellar hook-length control protein FliK [Thermoanaerobacteraceae bacterium]